MVRYSIREYETVFDLLGDMKKDRVNSRIYEIELFNMRFRLTRLCDGE